MSNERDTGAGGFSFVETVRRSGLDPSLLYEAVIDLAQEGFLTARCVNAAAGVLLTELGLPAYFFRHISPEALKGVLRVIATHLTEKAGRYALQGEVAEVKLDVSGGVQARVATRETRDRMEDVLESVMSGCRVEYYYGRERGYYTYIVRPEKCKPLGEIKEGETRFAFGQQQGQTMPEETRVRYESFLRRADASVIPLVEVSQASATRETRIMFRDDCCRSILPIIRKMTDDLGVILNRAYWETYRGPTGRVEAVCSFYLDGDPGPAKLSAAVAQLQALLALPASGLSALFMSGALSFDAFAFAVGAFVFVHHFICKELETDTEIMKSLERRDLRDALAKRVFDSNRSEYTRKVIEQAMKQNPALVAELFGLFDRKFNPAHKTRPTDDWMTRQIEEFRRKAAVAFMDDSTGGDIFNFMTRFVLNCHKTNFYRVRKRSFAFRFDAGILDPSIYTAKVHGVFLVAGFYAIGTHMRAEDISRGGLRLIRVTPGNYETELDNMPLLNYALGPVAQRLKHKDIAESGSKGVIVPAVEYARDGLRAVFDFTEGIMDLVQPAEDIVDCLGKPEMVFFGPDEGTAPFMDAVAERARERGYRYWRTITTGKSIGIPHDTYGLTLDRKVFGLLSHGEKGTELQMEGEQVLLTTDTARIVDRIGAQVDTSGMTTNGVMNCLRVALEEAGLKEEETRLMMTGGPDGDLGANQIQSFKGRVCLIVDGGSVLFDPNGLDRRELLKLAVARHTEPRLNSLGYPAEKLGPGGFKIPRSAGAYALPDGTKVEDGAFFHRGFLCDPSSRKLAQQAKINAFVPCGGFKDTINARNVRAFLNVFAELKVIVEGANVFFDDTARDVIARETAILQIKDSTANKGGVTSSSVAEVLPAFLLGDDYEKCLVDDLKTKARLVREVFEMIAANATAEARMLLALRRKTGAPLYKLSVQTSEWLLALQAKLYEHIDKLLARPGLVEAVFGAYVPPMLIERLGMKKALGIFSEPGLAAYRDAILTKKLASMALYRHAADWPQFLKRLEGGLLDVMAEVAAGR